MTIRDTCEHAPPGRQFSQKVRQQLRAEIQSIYGHLQCPICAYGKVFYVYECHHIRPWSEGGTSTTENGVLLCPNCHRLAHLGFVTPYELMELKASVRLPVPIANEQAARELIDTTSSHERLKSNSPVEVFSRSQKTLALLRGWETTDVALRQELWRTLARVQLQMAGALTSTRRSAGVRRDQSERYFITVLARNAARIGADLKEPYLELQGWHSLATNANALGNPDLATKYSERARRFLDWATVHQTQYAAYLARNLAVMYAKARHPRVADDLIAQSERLSEDPLETLVRQAEVLMLRGDMRAAERCFKKCETCAESAASLTAHDEVIASRLRAGYFCLVGDVKSALRLLEKAQRLAEEHEFGHQASKIALAIPGLSSKTRLKSLPKYREGLIRRPLPRWVVRSLF